ncbi:hypothetical protein IMSAG250_00482 [Clostridiales bacterium]|nr:hypothetical protein IMSAG250_00482 [Clostridiales bacterium]
MPRLDAGSYHVPVLTQMSDVLCLSLEFVA